MPPIILVGGSKGGVGKSLVCTSLLDYLRHHNRPVLLVEADASNPDVWKAHHAELGEENALPLDLETKDGWLDLANTLHAKPDHTAVINSPALFNQRIAAFGDLFRHSLNALQRPLITLWVINRQRDSLNLLKEFSRLLPEARLHVLRNAYFGDESKFELYNQSALRRAIEDKGGLSLTFPDLADRVADTMNINRLSIRHAVVTLPFGERIELERWQAAARAIFDKLFNRTPSTRTS